MWTLYFSLLCEGHNDPAAEPMLLKSLASRVDLSTEPQDSILKTNSRVLCRM
jgi:hypothetical protein